jgi:capsular polysaccharide biosynthesis protein
MAQEKTEFNFETSNLILYLWKRKIPLILITLGAAVISTLISFTITPKFRSSVVLFPASESPVSKSLLQTNFQDRIGILGFGDEDQLERILQVLHSDNIRDHVIDAYNLMEHYEIDPESAFPLTKLFGEYSSNIKFKRTEFNSIVIEVMDKDPQMAADIANDIASQIDSTMNKMKRNRAIKALELVEKEYLSSAERARAYNDSISMLHKKGIVSYDAQIERLTEAYGKAITENNREAVKEIEDKMREFQNYTAPFVYYWSMWSNEVGRLRDLEFKYIEAKAEAELMLSHVFVLDKAYKAEKKAYPKKSIIVMVATFATFVLAVMAFLFFESFLRKLRST